MKVKVRALLPSRRIVNMFGAIGYSVLIVSYAVVLGTVLLWLVKGGYGEAIGMDPAPRPQEPLVDEVTDPQRSSILVSIFAYSVMIVMMLVVIFITITLPYWLGRSGSYLMRKIIVLCRQPITSVTLLVAKVIASVIVCLPILLIVAENIANILTLIVVSGLMLLTLVLFLLQHYLAKMNHLQAKDIW